MQIHNSDVTKILTKIADLLDIKGANEFRVRAYRQAAQTISGMTKNISGMIDEDKDLSDLSNIGEDIAGKIEEIVETGSLKQLEELEKEIPPELTEIMELVQLGPKKVNKLYKKLNIKSIDDLEKAAKKNKLKKLDGFGEKTEKKILKEIKDKKEKQSEDRIPLFEAEQIAETLFDYLKEVDGIERIEIAGSYRRRKETIGDLDFVVTCKNNSKMIEHFTNYEDIKEVVSKGNTRSTIKLRDGFNVDLRIVDKNSFGAALCYFTGSKDHTLAIRNIAVEKNQKLNEYGLFKGDNKIAGKTEEALYNKLGLKYFEPEIRENRGEIEAAKNDNLPELVKLDDMKGDLQSHTDETDGRNTMEEMVEKAKDLGYDYFAITDHSKHVSVANGMDEKRFRKHLDKIDKLNEKYYNFRILKSVEVDILADGSLDLNDDVLKECDVVVFSIHYKFDLPEKKQTERVLKAMDNPNVHIFAHPTGRILGKRSPYEINIEKIIEAAKEKGCFIELNAQPNRLDLNDVYIKAAKDSGVKIAISTDAHSIDELEHMRYGIGQGRRGWLEKDDVINTRNWQQLKKLLKRS